MLRAQLLTKHQQGGKDIGRRSIDSFQVASKGTKCQDQQSYKLIAKEVGCPLECFGDLIKHVDNHFLLAADKLSDKWFHGEKDALLYYGRISVGHSVKRIPILAIEYVMVLGVDANRRTESVSKIIFYLFDFFVGIQVGTEGTKDTLLCIMRLWIGVTLSAYFSWRSSIALLKSL